MEYIGGLEAIYTNHLLTSWDIQVCQFSRDTR